VSDFVFCSFLAGLYLHAVTETKLVVDTSRGETLRINVMFLSMLCFSFSVYQWVCFAG